MDSYEINKDTVALIPKNNQTIVYEVDKSFVVNKSPLKIVEEKLEIETSTDANIDISFSAKYMLDALKTMKDDEILILLNGEVKPIVIKSMKDESLIQLILPIKTY